MRTRIFTPRERSLLEAWLRGEKVDTKTMSVILARIKYFRTLPGDVELYLKARRRLMAKPSKTVPT